jgi:hypothetical protein
MTDKRNTPLKDPARRQISDVGCLVSDLPVLGGEQKASSYRLRPL